MSDLLDKQFHLCRLIADLILAINAAGYQCKFGHAKRCTQGADGHECPIGHPNSLHKKSLAVDLLLFDSGGHYLQDTEAYARFGELFESWGGTWGGRFGDGNHFSVAWEEMK